MKISACAPAFRSGSDTSTIPNAVNGEAADGYNATVVYAPTVWAPPGAEPNLYAEGFEAWPPVSTR